MENSFLLFVSTAIVALAVENAVFARGLGVDNHAVFVKNPREGILMGGVFGWVVVWSALPVSLTNYLLRGNPYVMIIRAPIYLAGVMVVYVLTHYLSGKHLKDSKLAADIQKTLPIATFNTALFAVLFLSASQNFYFLKPWGTHWDRQWATPLPSLSFITRASGWPSAQCPAPSGGFPSC
jgi:electron transport complex protein RnfA